MGAMLAKERLSDVAKRNRGVRVVAVRVGQGEKGGGCDLEMVRMTKRGVRISLARDM